MRRMLLAYLILMTVAQWGLTTVDVVRPLDLPLHQALLFCTLYFPWAMMPAALALTWRDWRLNGARYQAEEQSDARWLALLVESFLFISIGYFLVQHIVAGREMHDLSIALDARIAFLPATGWAYVTNAWIFLIPLCALRDEVSISRLRPTYMSVSIVCWLCFLIYPVGIERPVPDTSTLAGHAIAVLYAADQGHNCFPSLHCAQSLLGALLLREIGRVPGALGLAAAIGIGVTTLTTKQHYVVDVFAGYGVALACYYFLRPGRHSRPDGRACARTA